ncbi:MAG TPA: SRPBCC domain-containing protein [Blastocatellia bacterium]
MSREMGNRYEDVFTRRQILMGGVVAVGGLAVTPAFAKAGLGQEPENQILRNAESIHQEPRFAGSRKRVYDALTDEHQFDKVIRLCAEVQSGGSFGDKPTEIDPKPGGAFVLFGGIISGRQIELVPNERIVQAWRVANWGRGIYSIVRFELVEDGPGTRIVLDHTGFPRGDAETLATGWKAHYWEPLRKYLA